MLGSILDAIVSGIVAGVIFMLVGWVALKVAQRITPSFPEDDGERM